MASVTRGFCGISQSQHCRKTRSEIFLYFLTSSHSFQLSDEDRKCIGNATRKRLQNMSVLTVLSLTLFKFSSAAGVQGRINDTGMWSLRISELLNIISLPYRARGGCGCTETWNNRTRIVWTPFVDDDGGFDSNAS